MSARVWILDSRRDEFDPDFYFYGVYDRLEKAQDAIAGSLWPDDGPSFGEWRGWANDACGDSVECRIVEREVH